MKGRSGELGGVRREGPEWNTTEADTTQPAPSGLHSGGRTSECLTRLLYNERKWRHAASLLASRDTFQPKKLFSTSWLPVSVKAPPPAAVTCTCHFSSDLLTVSFKATSPLFWSSEEKLNDDKKANEAVLEMLVYRITLTLLDVVVILPIYHVMCPQWIKNISLYIFP